jgi:hypothetical protein
MDLNLMSYRTSAADRLARAEEIGVCEPTPSGPARALDFTRPFMPEALARTAALGFLSSAEQRRLNQIRGNAYLTVVGLLDSLAQGAAPAESLRRAEPLAALRMAFAAGFGSPCEVIDAAAVAAAFADAPRLSRALLGLHVVWMAKRHMQAAALNARTLDPAFRRLIMDRWFALEPLGGGAGQLDGTWIAPTAPVAVDAGIEGYRRLCDGLSEALQAQAAFDLEALQRACRRILSAQEREQALAVQHHAYWWSFIGCGLTHPCFAEAVRGMKPGALGEFDGLIATLR